MQDQPSSAIPDSLQKIEQHVQDIIAIHQSNQTSQKIYNAVYKTWDQINKLFFEEEHNTNDNGQFNDGMSRAIKHLKSFKYQSISSLFSKHTLPYLLQMTSEEKIKLLLTLLNNNETNKLDGQLFCDAIYFVRYAVVLEGSKHRLGFTSPKKITDGKLFILFGTTLEDLSRFEAHDTLKECTSIRLLPFILGYADPADNKKTAIDTNIFSNTFVDYDSKRFCYKKNEIVYSAVKISTTAIKILQTLVQTPEVIAALQALPLDNFRGDMCELYSLAHNLPNRLIYHPDMSFNQHINLFSEQQVSQVVLQAIQEHNKLSRREIVSLVFFVQQLCRYATEWLDTIPATAHNRLLSLLQTKLQATDVMNKQLISQSTALKNHDRSRDNDANYDNKKTATINALCDIWNTALTIFFEVKQILGTLNHAETLNLVEITQADDRLAQLYAQLTSLNPSQTTLPYNGGKIVPILDKITTQFTSEEFSPHFTMRLMEEIQPLPLPHTTYLLNYMHRQAAFPKWLAATALACRQHFTSQETVQADITIFWLKLAIDNLTNYANHYSDVSNEHLQQIRTIIQYIHDTLCTISQAGLLSTRSSLFNIFNKQSAESKQALNTLLATMLIAFERLMANITTPGTSADALNKTINYYDTEIRNAVKNLCATTLLSDNITKTIISALPAPPEQQATDNNSHHALSMSRVTAY